MAYPTINNCVIDIGCLSDLFGDQKATILNFILDALAAIYTDGQADLTDIEAKIDIIDTNVDQIEAILAPLTPTVYTLTGGGTVQRIVPTNTAKRVVIFVETTGDTLAITYGGVTMGVGISQCPVVLGNGVTLINSAIQVDATLAGVQKAFVIEEA